MLRQPQRTTLLMLRAFNNQNPHLLLKSSQCFGLPVSTMAPHTAGSRMFSTKNDKDADITEAEKPAPKKRAPRAKKATTEAVKVAEGDLPVKKERKPRVTKAAKAEAERDALSTDIGSPFKMYVMKFNTPILPYAKFPLTQNKYIQDFLKMYEEDKDKIVEVLGVHFPQNNNSMAEGTVGIEIKITKKNNVTSIESFNTRRFRVTDYDSSTNFCMSQEFEDQALTQSFNKEKPSEGLELSAKDLLQSDLYELKNLWVTYNKKINSLLMILPAEVLNRYDMVVKSLLPPVFDMYKHPADTKFEVVFDEAVYKMAGYYFAVFQALFSKDNDSMRPMLGSFLGIKEPMMRSRRLISLFEEMHGIIDKKMYYVHKTAEEFKERSKTQLLEHAYQKVLEDNKKSEKTKYQEKLDAVKNMPDATRKVIQEEINGLDSKNDMDTSRKTNYLM